MTGEDMQPAMEFRRFSLAYRNGRGGQPVIQALQDVSLVIKPGEIVTVVGPSGCGKTTLLRAAAGLLSPGTDGVACDGSLAVFGMAPLEAKRKRLFAVTFQNPVLLPWRNVRQNVGLPLEIADCRDDALVDEMLAMVGIADFAEAMPSGISGGMQQRAGLARALVQNPKILLMDEPFGSLDELTRERLNFELLRIHRVKKPTIIFVTHSLSEAALLADRVVVLGRRPASVRKAIVVDLPRERTEDTLLSPDYRNLVRRIRAEFEGEEGGS